jgi:hypothetical protein
MVFGRCLAFGCHVNRFFGSVEAWASTVDLAVFHSLTTASVQPPFGEK